MIFGLEIKKDNPNIVVEQHGNRSSAPQRYCSAALLLFFIFFPAAAFSFDVEIVADPSSGEAPLEVEFSAVVKAGTAKSFQWEFGDGGKCKEQNCNHTFNRGGTYTVKLTVVSDAGVTVTKTMSFEVQRRKGG